MAAEALSLHSEMGLHPEASSSGLFSLSLEGLMQWKFVHPGNVWTCSGMVCLPPGVVLLAIVSRSKRSCWTLYNPQDSLTRNELVPHVSREEVKKVPAENPQAASAKIFPCMTLCSRKHFLLPVALRIKPRASCMVVKWSAQLHPHPQDKPWIFCFFNSAVLCKL